MLDKKAAAQSLLAVLSLAILIVIFVFAVVCYSPASTTTKAATNSLGAVIYQDNPNTYKAGSVVNLEYVGQQSNYGLSVRIRPLDTFMLFSENLLFCGDTGNLINGKRNPLVLSYETEVHHLVSGVGCHRLISVTEIREEK